MSMDTAAVRQGIYESLQEVLEDIGRIDDGAELSDNGMDSLNFIRLIVLLENRFGIVIADEDIDLQYFATVGHIVQLVERYLGGART